MFIWIDSDENNQLSLYNLSGQEIYNISTTSNNEKPIIIPFNYSSGVYILKQQNNLKTNLYKIIKF